MSTTEATPDGASRLIDSIQETEQTSLEAVRRFVDAVDSAFPDVSHEDGPRRKIIDSAFKMTEQLVGASNQLARNILDVTEKALNDPDRETAASQE